MRILVEPVSASTPGSQELVDRCPMPGYGDMVRLFFWEETWHIQSEPVLAIRTLAR
jgi:hypothetical protein